MDWIEQAIPYEGKWNARERGSMYHQIYPELKDVHRSPDG